MLFLIICFCWVACAYAAPATTDVLPLEKQQPTVIPIVSQSEEFEPNGSYKFSYETGNGIKREESSYSKLVPKAQGRSAADSSEGIESDSDEIHVQVGSYSYTAPDGTVFSVRYIADENGFQPIGDHIPELPKTVISNKKSGRNLKSEDNVEAGSAPSAKSTPQLESRSAVVEDDKANEITSNKANDVSKPGPTTEVTKTSKGKLTVASSNTDTKTTTEGPKSDLTKEETKATEEPPASSTASSLPSSTEATSSEISTTTEGKSEPSITTTEETKTKEAATTSPAIVVI